MLLPAKGKNCERIRYTQPIQEASTNEELQGAATQHGWNQGTPSANMIAHDCYSPFRLKLTHFEGTRIIPQTEFRRRNGIRSGTSRKCEDVRREERIFRRRVRAKFSRVRTGRATSRRSFAISLLVASIREPAAALRQSGPASSAWQEHHELPLICLLHGLPTGCTTCGLE